MLDSFTQLTEYFRLIDEYNAIALAKAEYAHQDIDEIDLPEMKELARRIEEKKREIRRTL